MKNKVHLCVFLLPLLIKSFATYAEVRLPAIVSSHMVLQRNTSVVLWGWAGAKEKITISASWLSKPLSIEATVDGTWKVQVQTTGSRAPQTIKITSKESNILLEDILFGEVWLCSGQSNMEMPVKGFNGQPIFGSLEAIANSRNNSLRLFTVHKVGALAPQQKVEKYIAWQAADPDNVKDFSAIAYFYGKQLQEILDVPVGMIHSSWGGSLVEAWMSNETLRSIQEVDLNNVDLTRGNRFPTVLFNAMINPLIPYAIKGVLWYQGEANRTEPEKYKKSPDN